MKIPKLAGLLAVLAAFILFPQVFSNPAVTTVATFTIFYAAAVTAWNIFSGYTGYIALGHAAYFGIGSYAMALMCQDWNVPGGYLPFLLIPLAGLVAAAFAVPLGWISLRTRRHTFVVITIAIFFIMQPMAFNLRSITGGSKGISLPIPLGWSGAFFNMPFYYAGLAILVLGFLVSWWIRNSKFGLGLLAIRDDEDRALGLGVRTGPSKLIAFVISAFFVGMVGALHAYFVESLFPAFAFDPLFDIALALMGFLGGIGTLAGPIVGALIVEPLQQYFTIQFSQNDLYLIVYGAMFLLIILLLPEGIVPTLQKYWRRATARASVTPTSAGAEVAAPTGTPLASENAKKERARP